MINIDSKLHPLVNIPQCLAHVMSTAINYNNQTDRRAEVAASQTDRQGGRQTDRQGGRQLITSTTMWGHTSTKTHSLCVLDAVVGVCMVPHISPRVGLWEPHCHFLSLQAPANHHQISSRSQPINDARDEVAQIAISALFPKKKKKTLPPS